MKKLMVLFVICTIALSSIGCFETNNNEENSSFFEKPIVGNFRPDLTFKVISPVEKVNGMEIGRVLIKSVEMREMRSALVVPPTRNLPIGSQVQLLVLKYKQGRIDEPWILVVK